MREYEVTYIVKATETDEAIDALVEQMTQVVQQQGAQVDAVEKWGRRRLAYDINKQREGYYVLLALQAETSVIAELERRFRMNDAVIRFLSVRIDEEIKRAKRRDALRARKKGVEPSTEVAGRTRLRPDSEAPVERSDDREDRSERSDGTDDEDAVV